MAIPTGPTFMSQSPVLIAEKDAISVPCLIFVIVLFFFLLFPLLLVFFNCPFSIICSIIFLKLLVFVPFVPLHVVIDFHAVLIACVSQLSSFPFFKIFYDFFPSFFFLLPHL